MLKNMSNKRKTLFWNAVVMIISYIAYVITYMIIGKLESSILVVAFATLAATLAAFAATAFATVFITLDTTAFAVALVAFAAFPVFSVTLAIFVAKDNRVGFWKVIPLYSLQTALVFLIFSYAPYASFVMIGVYGLTVVYLLVIEPKLIIHLKANPPVKTEQEEILNGAYRSSLVESGRYIPGFRLWLFKLLVH